MDIGIDPSSAGWFVAWAGLSGLGWAIGYHSARGPAWARRIVPVTAVLILLAWAWLMRHPAAAVQLLPASVLCRIEGVAAVPMFMVVAAAAWSRGNQPHQKHVAGWATLLGVVYFLHGGWWMVQRPAVGLDTRYGVGVVLQTRGDTCVAAACATALDDLGLPSSEAQMAALTMTRPGEGSTTLRAMAGLQRRLAGTSLAVRLVQPTPDRLDGIPLPAVVPIRVSSTGRHMVVVLAVSPTTVTLGDPASGLLVVERDDFVKRYLGRALVFERAGTGRDPLAARRIAAAMGVTGHMLGAPRLTMARR